ncbi:unnamed protein product [Prorocentrum cordatum]|uniref:Uncharacterized protein n=1 Tax=Prorocentrum cordatum TaxID=2364126 RepID=A0ABN9TTI6_9DINO|nr:unnamed protein product [Polarella glacialis]
MAAGGQGMFGEAHGFLRSMAEEVEAVKRLIASEDAKRVKEDRRAAAGPGGGALRGMPRLLARVGSAGVRADADRGRAAADQRDEERSGRRELRQAVWEAGGAHRGFHQDARAGPQVQSSWGKLIATCVDGEDQQHKRHLESVEESQVALRPQLDRAASKQMVDRLARSPLAGAPATPDHSTSRTERGEDRIPALIDRTLVRSGSKDPR